MSFTAIVGGIFALAKVVPTIKDIIVLVNSQILKWELAKITNEYTAREQMIDTLIDAISKADTREKRSDLSKVLHKYTTGDFSGRVSK